LLKTGGWGFLKLRAFREMLEMTMTFPARTDKVKASPKTWRKLDRVQDVGMKNPETIVERVRTNEGA